MSRVSRPVNKKLLAVRVMTMDAELEFTVPKTAAGKDLFELVCRAIGLRETWYFGLQYYDAKGFLSWLKPKKLLLKQCLASTGPLTFHLLIRFYPEDVSEELVQDITQHLFFLQVRGSILGNQVYCPPEEAILLASYDVQAKVASPLPHFVIENHKYLIAVVPSHTDDSYAVQSGSVDLLTHRKSSFLAAETEWGDIDDNIFDQTPFSVEDLVPSSVLRVLPDTPPEAWQNRIRQWHAEHRGLSKAEAEIEHLKVAQNLEMFGVSYFEISNKKESELYLGVTAFGLNIYEKQERRKPKISFPWSEIKNVSYEDTKFILRPIDKKVPNFSFHSSNLKLNKIILDLCIGNHDLYLRRRKPDSIEIQQMKLQAKEEKSRRYVDRQRFLRERQLREELQREKQELQRQLMQLQEEIRITNEEMRQCQEAAEILAKKAQICEEESVLLNQKAMDCETEIQQLKVTVLRSEEEKLSMERKVRDAQLMASRMVEEAERRAHEAESFKEELVKAKMRERVLCNRFVDITRPTTMHISNLRQEEGDFEYPEYGSHGYTRCLQNGSSGELDHLSAEIEREKHDFIEKSRHLQDQLNDFRTKLETIKTDDGLNGFPTADIGNMRKEKFATLQQASAGSTKARITTFENL